jgi:hypothetical protein
LIGEKLFHPGILSIRGAVQERPRLAEQPTLPAQSKVIMLVVKS